MSKLSLADDPTYAAASRQRNRSLKKAAAVSEDDPTSAADSPLARRAASFDTSQQLKSPPTVPLSVMRPLSFDAARSATHQRVSAFSPIDVPRLLVQSPNSPLNIERALTPDQRLLTVPSPDFSRKSPLGSESPKQEYLTSMTLAPSLLGQLSALASMHQAMAAHAMETDPAKQTLLSSMQAMSSHESGSSFDMTTSLDIAGPSGIENFQYGNVPTATAEMMSSMPPKAVIQEDVRTGHGRFQLVKKRGRSEVWNLFGQVMDTHSQVRLPYVACYACKVLYTDTGGGTGNMTRHRCPLGASYRSDKGAFSSSSTETVEAGAGSSFESHQLPVSRMTDVKPPLSVLVTQDSGSTQLVSQNSGEVSIGDVDREVLTDTLIRCCAQDMLDPSIFNEMKEAQEEGGKNEAGEPSGLVKEEPMEEPPPVNAADLLSQLNESCISRASPVMLREPRSDRDTSAKKELMRLIAMQSSEINLVEHPRFSSIRVIERLNSEGDEEGFKRTNYVLCSMCNLLLTHADGGHLKRHVLKTCPSASGLPKEGTGGDTPATPKEPKKRVTAGKAVPLDPSKVATEMAVYCLRSGLNFSQVEDAALRQLLASTGASPKDAASLPGPKDVEMNAKLLHINLVGRACAEVREQIINGGGHLIVDFGRHIPNILSIFYSTVTSKDGSWRPFMTPIGFTPYYVEKEDAHEVFDQIKDVCAQFGLAEALVKQCALVADGSPVVRKCALRYMKDYIHCGSTSLDHLTQAALTPDPDTHSQFTQDEMDWLLTANELVAMSAELWNSSRQIRSLLPSSSSPQECPYQAMSCLLTVLDTLLEQNATLHPSLRPQVEHVWINRRYLEAVEEVFCLLKPAIAQLQVTGKMILHRVALIYKQVIVDLEQHRRGASENMGLKILIKSTLIAIKAHAENALGDIHYAATFLSPETKDMKNFAKEDRERAQKYIVSLLPDCPESSAKRMKLDIGEELTEHRGYLNDDFWEPDTPILKYWFNRQLTFPELSQAARQVFGVISPDYATRKIAPVAKKLLSADFNDKDLEWVLTTYALLDC